MTTLVTGNVSGNLLTQEELYIEGAPYIYFQDATANPLNNPDVDGYYWNLSGTSTYPVRQIGCVQDVSLSEDVTMNDIRCDTTGDKGVIQKRNFIELTFKILSLFPLSLSSYMLNFGSTPLTLTDKEKVGIGSINNNTYWMVYAPKVYDETLGRYLTFHLHRCQFVDAWTIDFKQGEPWAVSGLKLRAFADDNKPTTQKFGVIVRADALNL